MITPENKKHCVSSVRSTSTDEDVIAKRMGFQKYKVLFRRKLPLMRPVQQVCLSGIAPDKMSTATSGIQPSLSSCDEGVIDCTQLAENISANDCGCTVSTDGAIAYSALKSPHAQTNKSGKAKEIGMSAEVEQALTVTPTKTRKRMSVISTSFPSSKKQRVDSNTFGSPQVLLVDAPRSIEAIKFANCEFQEDSDFEEGDGDGEYSVEDCVPSPDGDETSVSSDDSDLSDRRKGNDRKQKKQFSIRFASHANVVEIPNRLSYTMKQQHRMWNGNKAIRSNAKRNKIEFEWENWDWEHSLEEDEFESVDGVLVHPAHLSL